MRYFFGTLAFGSAFATRDAVAHLVVYCRLRSIKGLKIQGYSILVLEWLRSSGPRFASKSVKALRVKMPIFAKFCRSKIGNSYAKKDIEDWQPRPPLVAFGCHPLKGPQRWRPK